MSTGSDPSKVSRKSNVYFAIGGALFLLMGLLSSVDESIAYILLGSSCYLFFLGFYTLPRSPRRAGASYPNDRGRSQRQSSQDPYIGSAFNATLWSQLFKLKDLFAAGKTPQASNRRAVKLFLLIFFGIFAIPIIGSIFSSDDASYASSYYQIAETQYAAGQFDSAYFYYKQALKEDPDYEEAWLGYGKVFSAKELCDSAIIIYDKVLELNRDNKYATYYKAYCYYHNKRYAEGVDLVVPLVENNDDYYEAMLLLGDFYYAQAKNDDALKWYDKAYNDGGMRSLNLCYIMGYLYQDKKDFNKAISLYQEALTYDTTQVDIYQRLGELIPDSKGDSYRVKAAQLKTQ
ncbi:MAG: tetratricopeptide repeat protein [Chryseolinea sp.]